MFVHVKSLNAKRTISILVIFGCGPKTVPGIMLCPLVVSAFSAFCKKSGDFECCFQWERARFDRKDRFH